MKTKEERLESMMEAFNTVHSEALTIMFNEPSTQIDENKAAIFQCIVSFNSLIRKLGGEPKYNTKIYED